MALVPGVCPFCFVFKFCVSVVFLVGVEVYIVCVGMGPPAGLGVLFYTLCRVLIFVLSSFSLLY